MIEPRASHAEPKKSWFGFPRLAPRQILPDPVYRELVDMLFTMRLPIAGMGALVAGLGLLILREWRDPTLAILTFGSALATVVRLFIVQAYLTRPQRISEPKDSRIWERRYAYGNYVFAILLGAVNVRLFESQIPLLYLTGVTLLLGFGAGLVARISIRPLICVVSLLLAAVPTAGALIFHAFDKGGSPMQSEILAVEALLVILITAMSLSTVGHLYRSTVDHLVTKHDLSFLARKDDLTGLPNRLMLRERFNETAREMSLSDRRMAVHFLDLDGFKAINDRFGHPTGDMLLQEVARRLSATVRIGDTVARIGGDEFVIVQAGIGHEDEAEILGRRIIKQLSAPYEISGFTLQISASVGVAIVPEHGADLDKIAAEADAALYRSKSSGAGRLTFASSIGPSGSGGVSSDLASCRAAG